MSSSHTDLQIEALCALKLIYFLLFFFTDKAAAMASTALLEEEMLHWGHLGGTYGGGAILGNAFPVSQWWWLLCRVQHVGKHQ